MSLLVAGYLAVSLLAGVMVVEGALHPGRRTLAAADEGLGQELAHNHSADLREVAILANDGVTLSAWSIRPHDGRDEAVILLHGLSDNRMGMIGYADFLLSHGFTVLMPDARAHGASGGELATYGLLESQDVRLWFDWLQRSEHARCIYGFAESMGAAQLLQSLQTEAHFCAVASESPFSSLREIAYDRVGQFFHTGPCLGRTVLRPMVEIAFGYARWKYKMNFDQVSPQSVVANNKVPVFLIHGQIDSNVPVRHSRLIAAANPNLTLWEVANADHCGAITAARGEFEQRLLHWFEDHPGIQRSLAFRSGRSSTRSAGVCLSPG